MLTSLFGPGLVEVEEGEVNGQELSIASHSVARISFAKKPHVEQVSTVLWPTVDLEECFFCYGSATSC